MNKHDKIFVAGHNGLVGSTILRNLKDRGYTNIITRNRSSCDLTNPVQVRALFQDNQIDYVFDAAAKVGGIVANRDFGHFIRKYEYLSDEKYKKARKEKTYSRRIKRRNFNQI